MKAKEFREMSLEELYAKEGELYEQLFKLRVQHSIGQLENPSKIRLVRKDIARLKTVLKERKDAT